MQESDAARFDLCMRLMHKIIGVDKGFRYGSRTDVKSTVESRVHCCHMRL